MAGPLRVRALGAALFALLLTAGSAPPSAAGLDGAWVLERLTDAGREVGVNPRWAPTATFAGARLVGTTPCNGYGAAVKARGGSVRVAELTTTGRPCPDRLDGLEERFLVLLAGARSFVRSGDRLVVVCDDGRLAFRRVP